MYKSKLRLLFIVIFAFMLLGVGSFLVGCGSNDPYAKMRIKANKSSVSLYIEVNNSGGINTAASTLEDSVTMTVSGAPNQISKAVTVMSLNSAVATAEVVSTSGERTNIKIHAVNSGKTQIKAMTSGGGKTMLIDVKVDIPAQALNIKEDTYLGVMRGERLELKTNNFNFYASSIKTTTSYTTTLNTVTYSFAASVAQQAAAQQSAMPEINGSILYIPKDCTLTEITIIPTLEYLGIAAAENEYITVHVFEPFPVASGTAQLDVDVLNAPKSDKTGLHTVQLVRNADAADAVKDIVSSGVDFLNNATYSGAFGTKWGYEIVNHDNNIVDVNDAGHTSRFDFVAYNIGSTAVDIVFYPIWTDPSNSSDKIHFNKNYHSELQKTLRITVEVRNIFKADSLAFVKSGQIVDSINSFYTGAQKPDVREFFSLGVIDTTSETAKLSSVGTVNNTASLPNNNYVTFEVKEIIDYDGDTPIYSEVYIDGEKKTAQDLFKFTYCEQSSNHDHDLDVVMLAKNFTDGVPYSALFSIAIKNAALLNLEGRQIVLFVKSIHVTANTSTPLVQANIPITCIQSVASIDVYTAQDNIGQTDQAVKVLYPVLGGNAVDFYINTDENSVSDYFDFSFNGEDAGLIFDITAVDDLSLTDGKTSHFRLSLIGTPSANGNYSFNIIHRCGRTVTISIKILEKWAATPTVKLGEVSGDMIYNKSFEGNTLTAFVRIGGTYSIDVTSYSAARASAVNYNIVDQSGASIKDQLAAAGLQISGVNQKWFKPTQETVYNFCIKIGSSNEEEYNGFANSFIVKLVVVNPVVSAAFDKNYVQVLSAGTLGFDSALGMTRAESIVDFNLLLQYAVAGHSDDSIKSTQIEVSFANMTEVTPEADYLKYYSNGIIELGQYKDNPTKFTLVGLRDSISNILITFKIKQVYKIDGIEVPIEFTTDITSDGLNLYFYALVKDAVTIESITPLDVGEYLNVTLNMNTAQTAVLDTYVTVRTSIYPASPHNARLGYSFLNPDGALVQYLNNALGDRVIEVNQLSGQIVAKQNNITSGQDIILVIYALDSIKSPGGFPQTYIKISVFIYDKTVTSNQRVISTLEQFLEAFYVKKSGISSSITLLQAAKNGQLESRKDLGSDWNNSCYYQLGADIDLSYLENGNTKYLILPPIQNFGAGSKAVFNGTQSYAMTGGVKSTNYSILNYRMTADTCVSEIIDSKRVETYGFFASLGAQGTVEGISFTNVSGYIMPSSNVIDRNQVNIGIVAGVIKSEGTFKGTIRDVRVSVSDENEFYYSIGSDTKVANVGGLVGVNNGLIEETTGSIYCTGTISIGIGQQESMINFGGIVGLNYGELKGKDAGGVVLDDNILINSDVALALLYGDKKTSTWYSHSADKYVNIGGIAGANTGLINEFSSEAVIYNSARGNTGGLVGYNYKTGDGNGSGKITNSYSNSAMYARGAMGGVVGRNSGGTLENCYYDLYLNQKVKNNLNTILNHYVLPVSRWGGEAFYAGLVVGTDGGNSNYYDLSSSPTAVGGVVGINDGGDLSYCFASSAFTNSTSKIEMFDLAYKGDVFIFGAERVIVGGVIGRQDDTKTHKSEILGCYSTLSVYCDDNDGRVENATKIGGVVGYLNNSSSTFSYCYSAVTVNNTQHALNKSSLSFGGLVGQDDGNPLNPTKFELCYTIIDSAAVKGANQYTVIDPIYAGKYALQGVTFDAVIYAADKVAQVEYSGISKKDTLIGINLETWTAAGSGNKANAHFTQVSGIGYDYPLVYKNDKNEPLIIVAPYEIDLTIKTIEQYATIYGTEKNNRGGFNFVLPNETNSKRAALFLSGGSYTASSVAANRYYLDDLFMTEVSPLIASKRIAFSISGAGTDVAQSGIELDAVTGKPKYFIDVKKLGAFDLVVSSTRYIYDGYQDKLVLVTDRLTFDIIDGIKYQSATTAVVGTVGRKTLLTRDQTNGYNITNGSFSIQKSTSFSLTGETDNSMWGIKIFAFVTENADSVSVGPVNYNVFTQNNGTGFGGYFINGTNFVFNKTGHAKFGFVPYIIVNGQEYRCYALAFEIEVTVYGGAIDLDFEQSVNTSENIQGGSVIDASSSVVTKGVFVTDIEPVISGGSVTNEEKLLSLTYFRFRVGNQNYSLFEDGSVSTILNNLGGQNFSLVFELKVNEIKAVTQVGNRTVAGYKGYYFTIYISVVVDADGEFYGNIDPDKITEPLVAVAGDIKGTIVAIEKPNSDYIDAVPLTAGVNLEIIAQDLQAVEIQHYANAERLTNNNGDLTDNLSLDESQHQSMNIYTDIERGGLLKVYALPYYANIQNFTLAMDKSAYANSPNSDKPWMQLVGYTTDRIPLPIYEEWSITFVQMVYDVNTRTYIKLAERSTGEFYQVSTYNNGVYGWTGVYYIQTRLVEPLKQYIGEYDERIVEITTPSVRIKEGKFFDIKAEFTTNGNRKISREFKLYALDVPGLYFNYENTTTKEVEQAIGTTVDFSISLIPADKIAITRRVIIISGVEVEIDGTEVNGIGSLSGLVKTTYDAISKSGTIWISPQFNITSGSFITLKFEYSRTENNGGVVQESAELTIKPVLFKVRGFTIDGISGTSIRLTNSNRQRAALRADVTYSDNADSALQTRIVTALADFNIAINSGSDSELVQWSAAGYQLNTNWNSETEYYRSGAEGLVNFYLGKSASTREKFIVDASGESQTSSFNVEMYFDYVAGVPVIKQYSTRRVVSTFQVMTIKRSSEQTPIIITQANANLLKYMSSDSHYIIMEDITLDNWTPVAFTAKSLDGNNKKITINSFNLTALPTDIGLFSTVETNCVLKNINLALPSLANSLDIVLTKYDLQSIQNKEIKIGMLAGTNYGVITNCAVVNQNQFTNGIVNYNNSTYDKANNKGRQQISVYIGNTALTVHVGGLVGENGVKSNKQGVISNSRVMVDIVVSSYYDQTANEQQYNVKKLTVAGFAAINSGTIVNSFFRDSNITNSAKTTEANGNLTAGFVGSNKNGAVIKGCYAMGVSDALNPTTGCVEYGEIKSANNNVSAFAYENSGGIEDCYANVRITSATAAAGFVYTNSGTGIVRNCFVNNYKTPSITSYYGFVYDNTSADRIENCMFVGNERGFAVNPLAQTDLKILSQDSGHTNYMGDITNFDGSKSDAQGAFSIAAYTADEDANTIWSMTATGPVLVGANEIAISVRILEPITDSSNNNIFSYLPEYSLGTKINPVLVANGDQFNSYIYLGTDAALQDESGGEIDYERNIYAEHVRLVNYISLKKKGTDGTGDLETYDVVQTYKTTFKGVLDGNGLEIRDISINATSAVGQGLRSVGLFSKLEYATVKNLTLIFAGQVTARDANYAGGLAGVSVNSSLVDLNVRGSNAEILGRSVVGGVVGMVVAFDDGNGYNSKIENIKSNVQVYSAASELGGSIINLYFESSDEYMQYDYFNLSIAGGVFGWITGTPRADIYIDNSGISHDIDIIRNDIDGNAFSGEFKAPELAAGMAHVKNIGNYGSNYLGVTGEVVGGLIGIIDSEIIVDDADYDGAVGTNYALRGKFFVGGLVGANLGTLSNSNISLAATEGMNLQSAAGSSYIFHSATDVNNIVYNYHGMTVGGAVGFNCGVIDSINAAVSLNSANFSYVHVLGGLVGENKGMTAIAGGSVISVGGIIKNCTVGGSGLLINGGYYIGGLVGLNHSAGSEILDNSVLFTNWNGTGFSGNMILAGTGASIFASYRNLNKNLIFFNVTTSTNPAATYDSVSGRYWVTDRKQFSGAYIGVNLEPSLVFSGSPNISIEGTIRNSGWFGSNHLN